VTDDHLTEIVRTAIKKRRPNVLSLKLNIVTERRGLVVNIPASYSGGHGFKSRPRPSAILIEGFRGFPQSLQTNAGIIP
jgi:hypothetical protein